jgi:hypothetical protein
MKALPLLIMLAGIAGVGMAHAALTPLELELLESAWPYIWTGMLAGITMFIKSKAKEQNARLDSICDSLKLFQKDVVRIETAMAADRADNRHRIDVLIGSSDARISRIEAICDTQHGTSMNRRSTDVHPIHWAQASDVQGSNKS